LTPVIGTKVVDYYTLIGVAPGHLIMNSKKIGSVCAPVDVEGQDPTAPSHPEHEVGYRSRVQAKTARFNRVLNQQVTNFEFGTLTVDVLRPQGLWLVSSKNLLASPPAPAAPVNDNYSCYKIRTSRNTPKFIPVSGVTLGDQFGTQTMTRQPTRRAGTRRSTAGRRDSCRRAPLLQTEAAARDGKVHDGYSGIREQRLAAVDDRRAET
jgi:hypothetical protein